jgi:hypothetical protein
MKVECLLNRASCLSFRLPVITHKNRYVNVKKKIDIGEFCDTLSIYFDLHLFGTSEGFKSHFSCRVASVSAHMSYIVYSVFIGANNDMSTRCTN